MRRLLFVALAMGIGLGTFGDEPETVVPVHILAPEYSVIAKIAHIAGEVEVRVTISENGTVMDATAVDGPHLLYRTSQDAVRQWTFAKPSSAPLTESVYCDFKLNDSVINASPVETVTFDMPNRVTIVATPELVQAQAATKKMN